jgi:hypothetical protein
MIDMPQVWMVVEVDGLWRSMQVGPRLVHVAAGIAAELQMQSNVWCLAVDTSCTIVAMLIGQRAVGKMAASCCFSVAARTHQFRMVTGPVSMPLTGREVRACTHERAKESTQGSRSVGECRAYMSGKNPTGKNVQCSSQQHHGGELHAEGGSMR